MLSLDNYCLCLSPVFIWLEYQQEWYWLNLPSCWGHLLPLWGESTSDWWIPLTKSPVTRKMKMFPFNDVTVMCRISKCTFEIPHNISYAYTERSDFYSTAISGALRFKSLGTVLKHIPRAVFFLYCCRDALAINIVLHWTALWQNQLQIPSNL